jgi:hypothetical protein
MNCKHYLFLFATLFFIGCATKQQKENKRKLIYGSWRLAEASVNKSKANNDV